MTDDENVDDLPDAFGSVIFCDDIRYEVGGKVTYVGTYKGALNVHGDFPANLARFGFAISLTQKRKAFAPNAKLLIFLPGDPEEAPSITADINEEIQGEILNKLDATRPESEKTKPLVKMEAHFLASPLHLKETGAIKVKALLGEKVVKLGRLEVRQEKSPMPSPQY